MSAHHRSRSVNFLMYIIRSSFDWLQVDLLQFSPVESDPQDIREFVLRSDSL